MNHTYINPTVNTSKWYVIDAKNKNLGRLSTKIATLLMGKNKNHYTPYNNHRCYIIVINARHINVTGNKKYQKTYKRHSGRPGGLTIETFEQLNKRYPNRIIEKSVKGMLPKNPLGRQLFRQLKIYSNDNHLHSAQQPELMT